MYKLPLHTNNFCEYTIITLKMLNLKKQQNKIDFFFILIVFQLSEFVPSLFKFRTK